VSAERPCTPLWKGGPLSIAYATVEEPPFQGRVTNKAEMGFSAPVVALRGAPG